MPASPSDRARPTSLTIVVAIMVVALAVLAAWKVIDYRMQPPPPPHPSVAPPDQTR